MDPNAAIHQALGVQPEIVTRNTEGSAGQCIVFEATLPSGAQVVLKGGETAEATEAEAWCCQRARDAGVPAPHVLAVDTTREHFPHPYFVMERATGVDVGWQDWTPEHTRNSYAILRDLHAINLDGYGWVHAGGTTAHTTWRDALERDWLKDLHLIAEHDHVRDTIHRHAALLDYPGPACFVHADYGTGHVFFEGTTVTGIIDFADVTAGDPVFEFARLARRRNKFAADAHGYFGAAPIPEDFWAKTTLYRMIMWSCYAAWRTRRGIDTTQHSVFIREAVDQLR